jgi:hypothetical protein
MLIAVTPAALPEGSYRLFVRTLSKGGKPLQGSAAERISILHA